MPTAIASCRAVPGNFLRRLMAAALAGCLLAVGVPAWAQVPAAPAAPAADPPKIPDPEEVTLHTKDGVVLKCTYYAGTKGKKSVPIIIVHGFEGQRREYDGLATMLQARGHAVIVPDLRGHGGSTTRMDGGTVDPDRFRAADLEAMILLDMEEVKKFLVEKNNLGELNIEALCVVGTEVGAIVALNWSMLDWNAPVLPSFKQGQDVKGIVLISPVQSFKGLTTTQAMVHPTICRLPTMIIVGRNDTKSYADAKRLNDTFERSHPRNPTAENKDLFFELLPTSLHGAKLLTGQGLQVDERVAAFIRLRLEGNIDKFPWSERRNPLGGN